MRLFLDANVIVSILNKEYPLFTYSSRVLSLADNEGFEVYTSPLCLAIAFYFAQKKHGTAHARDKINLLIGKIRLTDITEKTVVDTSKNKKIHDFEDGLQYYSAIGSDCKFIITEDIKDFYFSEIEVLNTGQFLKKYVF